jgi:hypothetical protein
MKTGSFDRFPKENEFFMVLLAVSQGFCRVGASCAGSVTRPTTKGAGGFSF